MKEYISYKIWDDKLVAKIQYKDPIDGKYKITFREIDLEFIGINPKEYHNGIPFDNLLVQGFMEGVRRALEDLKKGKQSD